MVSMSMTIPCRQHHAMTAVMYMVVHVDDISMQTAQCSADSNAHGFRSPVVTDRSGMFWYCRCKRNYDSKICNQMVQFLIHSLDRNCQMLLWRQPVVKLRHSIVTTNRCQTVMTRQYNISVHYGVLKHDSGSSDADPQNPSSISDGKRRRITCTSVVWLE